MKDGIKTGRKGIGGRRSDGKKGMEVGIFLHRRRRLCLLCEIKCGEGSDGKYSLAVG